MAERPPTDTKNEDASSEAQTRRIPMRGIALTSVLVLVGLLASELTVRLVDDRLPKQLEWHAWEAQHKVEQMDAFARRNHRAKIVAVGASEMFFGLNPRALDDELGGGRLAYNAALPGGIPRIMELWTTKVVLPRLHPEVLLVSVNSADLNDNGPSQKDFYDFFASSPAVRHLMDTETWLERLDRRFAGWSDLWRFRWILRRPADLMRAIRGQTIAAGGEPVGADGVGLSQLNRRLVATPGSIRAFQRRRRETWLKNYSIGSVESGALLRLVQSARAQGIAVVVVEMPVTKYFAAAHPHGEADLEAFHRAIDRIVSTTGSVFVDASHIAATDDYFGGFVHLNGAGTKAFTSFIAQRLRALGLA